MDLTQANLESRKMDKPSTVQAREVVGTDKQLVATYQILAGLPGRTLYQLHSSRKLHDPSLLAMLRHSNHQQKSDSSCAGDKGQH